MTYDKTKKAMTECLSEIFILLYKHIKQILEDHLNTEYLYMK